LPKFGKPEIQNIKSNVEALLKKTSAPSAHTPIVENKAFEISQFSAM
jgi:hypothetical protein